MTEPHAAAVMGEFIRVQETFAQLSDAVQPSHMGVESQNCLDWIVNYLYADLSYYDALKLIFCCSEGTPYQHFMHQMVEVEVEATYQFLNTLRRPERTVPKIDRQLCHILSRAACSAASLKYRGARYAEGTGKAVCLRFADVLSDQMEKTNGENESLIQTALRQL